MFSRHDQLLCPHPTPPTPPFPLTSFYTSSLWWQEVARVYIRVHSLVHIHTYRHTAGIPRNFIISTNDNNVGVRVYRKRTAPDLKSTYYSNPIWRTWNCDQRRIISNAKDTFMSSRGCLPASWNYTLAINVPLILKVRDIIFFSRVKRIMGHFAGHFAGSFGGVETFLTPKLSWAWRRAVLGSKKSRPPQKIPRNYPLYVLPQTKKLISRTFKIRGTLVFFCPKERESKRARKRDREREWERERERERERVREREQKCRQLNF